MSSWLQFQEGVYSLTEQDVKAISKQIIAVYRDSIKDISEQIAGQYLKYLSSVGTDNYYNEMIKYNRLTNLMADVQKSYRSYSLRAQTLTEHTISVAASNSYYRSMFASSWLTGGVYGKIPYELVELIVYGTSDAWKAIPKSIIGKYGSLANYQSKSGTLTEFILKNRAEELRQIQNTITTGLQQGLSYPQMASSIRDVIGTVTKNADGTLTASGAMGNASRIVSTESVRAMSAAAFASSMFLQSEGVNVKKRWMATLDNRTRGSHARLDGKTIDLKDKFKIGDDSALYPGGFGLVKNNIRCRCTTVEVIDNEGPQIRIGRNPITGKNEVFEWADFGTWAKDKGLTSNLYGEIF
jgi:SPP1 gp7 family putative phage head morphogenesis protein